MEEDFIKKIKKVFLEKEIVLSDEQANMFFNYYNLLKEWNEKINLTTIIEEDDVIYKHFLDSAVATNKIKNNAKVLDIGSGAGFPGIPLKILRSDLDVTLVDSVNKKTMFLNEVIKQLNLKNIKAVHTRIEDYANKNNRESFDYVVSRACSKLNVLCEYSLPFLKNGGKLIAYKSVETENEILEAQKAIEILGGKFEKIENVNFAGLERTLVYITKIKTTPNKYPRSGNKPRLNPII